VLSIEEFKRAYEFITDNVIPYSAKQLKVPEKDGLTIWYHIIYLGQLTFLMSSWMMITSMSMKIMMIMIPRLLKEKKNTPHLLLSLLIRLEKN